jgi:hypothetical protein
MRQDELPIKAGMEDGVLSFRVLLVEFLKEPGRTPRVEGLPGQRPVF